MKASSFQYRGGRERSSPLKRALALCSLALVAVWAGNAWAAIYECRDHQDKKILTDSPTQLDQCKVISTTPSPAQRPGFPSGPTSPSYSDNPSTNEPSPVARFPPGVIVSGQNGEVLQSASDMESTAGQPPLTVPPPSQASNPTVNQLHPFLPPVQTSPSAGGQKP